MAVKLELIHLRYIVILSIFRCLNHEQGLISQHDLIFFRHFFYASIDFTVGEWLLLLFLLEVGPDDGHLEVLGLVLLREAFVEHPHEVFVPLITHGSLGSGLGHVEQRLLRLVHSLLISPASLPCFLPGSFLPLFLHIVLLPTVVLAPPLPPLPLPLPRSPPLPLSPNPPRKPPRSPPLAGARSAILFEEVNQANISLV